MQLSESQVIFLKFESKSGYTLDTSSSTLHANVPIFQAAKLYPGQCLQYTYHLQWPKLTGKLTCCFITMELYPHVNVNMLNYHMIPQERLKTGVYNVTSSATQSLRYQISISNKEVITIYQYIVLTTVVLCTG